MNILADIAMSLFQIAEIFGYAVENTTAAARDGQERRWCPFRNTRCAKGSKSDPLGICSLTNGSNLAVVCPYRFLENSAIFREIGRIAFGPGTKIVAAPEVHILRVLRESREHRVGKVDYLGAKLGENEEPLDFAALEVQAVYFSGDSLRPAFRHFMENTSLPSDSNRRPDWRSSAQKRLMPQLALKVPVFRRWGKKFFVAVDSNFYASLPPMGTVDSLTNSEITWVVYPFNRDNSQYTMGNPTIHYSTWDDVMTALREGIPPDPQEILADIKVKARKRHLPVHTT